MRSPPLRILLIDDDPVDREVVRHQLVDSGQNIEYETADSGRRGLDLIRSWKADCVLLDLNPPDMQGLELLRSAIVESHTTPVIVITAHGSEEITVEAMRNGAADYLIKGTLNANTLAHSVNRVLEREALRRQVERQRLDIEERNREVEAGLARERAARTAAEKAEQLLGQRQKLESIGLLAGGIAHDFNNLLVGIIGAVSYTLDLLPADHEARSMLELALNSGERAAHLVRQMLAYAGKGRFVVEKVDLSELVHKTWNLIRASIPSSIRVQFLTRPGLPLLETDSSQIEQIIMNLLINAAEAIPPDRPGRIIVRTDLERILEPLPSVASDLEPGSFLLLEVRDDGCGMDEATKAKIFDPFFTTKFMGRGLGLAAVQDIVRNNNGAVLVESAVGRGTSLRILLPPGAPAAAPNVVPIDEAKALETPRVLVVDDEPTVLDVAKVALERAGYQVQLATTGQEAVQMVHAAAGRFSIVLLDLSMPAMGGIEALGEIRAMNRELPILLCSGYSEWEMRKRSEGLLVQGFVQKPFTAKSLRDKVAFHMRSAQSPARTRGAG